MEERVISEIDVRPDATPYMYSVLCTEDGVITPSQNGLVACDLLCRWQLSQSAPRLSLQVILDSTGSSGSRTAVQA